MIRTWGGLARPWLADGRRFAWLAAVAPAAAAALVVLAPLAGLLVALTLALSVALWRDRAALPLLLIVLMVNVKVNFYTGFVTLFPEYPLLLLALAIALARGLEGRFRIEEKGFALLFAWFILAGAVSGAHALVLSRVASKEVLLVLAAVIFFAVVHGLDSRVRFARALRWLEASAFAVAVYSVVQIVGGALGVDTSLSFLERYSNPDIYLGVGAPVVFQLTKIFRANGLFNDPNILGGYLAAVMAFVLALRLHHGTDPARRGRARAETALLLLLATALLLTLSRSGFLALGAGAVTVFAFMPEALRRVRFWVATASVAAVAALGATLSGINPVLLVLRLGQAFDRGDVSSRVHYEVAAYALDLLRRFPLTGAGLRNFGYFYAAEVDAYFPNMMAHNAWLDFFAETGLFGGLAFTAITLAVVARPWRSLRDPVQRRDDPERHAWLAGGLAAMIALNVANLFYDYYLRTFVWVFSGMVIAAVRLRAPGSRAAA